jgi:hypothetical protein
MVADFSVGCAGQRIAHTFPVTHPLRLELPSIGWQLFVLGNSQSDSTAFQSSLDTYATRLLTEPLS